MVSLATFLFSSRWRTRSSLCDDKDGHVRLFRRKKIQYHTMGPGPNPRGNHVTYQLFGQTIILLGQLHLFWRRFSPLTTRSPHHCLVVLLFLMLLRLFGCQSHLRPISSMLSHHLRALFSGTILMRPWLLLLLLLRLMLLRLRLGLWLLFLAGAPLESSSFHHGLLLLVS